MCELPEGYNEDEIVALADAIQLKRLNEKKITSFHEATTVFVRWDVPHRSGLGVGYLGVTIPKHIVEDYVVNYFRHGDTNG